MFSRVNFPTSILEKSRMSLRTARSPSAQLRKVLMYSRDSCGVSESIANSAIPRMPCMGVRISWLMLARNWPLARFADSAAVLASSSSRHNARHQEQNNDEGPVFEDVGTESAHEQQARNARTCRDGQSQQPNQQSWMSGVHAVAHERQGDAHPHSEKHDGCQAPEQRWMLKGISCRNSQRDKNQRVAIDPVAQARGQIETRFADKLRRKTELGLI